MWLDATRLTTVCVFDWIRSGLLAPQLEERLGALPNTILLRLSACHRLLGGYSAGVPPLPIPNRAVKPRSADGTAFVVGE